MYAGKHKSVEPIQLFGKNSGKHKLRPRAGTHKLNEMKGGARSVSINFDNDMDDAIMPESSGTIIIIIVVCVLGFFAYNYFFKSGLSTLGSGGTSGNIPNIPLFAPEIHDNPDANIGHGLAYGQYEYDIFAKTGRTKENDEIDDWMREDIEKDKKFQQLQVPTIPGDPAGGGPWLLGKDFIGDFEKRLRIPENPGRIGGDPKPDMGVMEPDRTLPMKDNYSISSGYTKIQDKLRSPDYIMNRTMNNPTLIKNKTNVKQNKHIERMKEEINSSNKLSGGDAVDLALRRDSSVSL